MSTATGWASNGVVMEYDHPAPDAPEPTNPEPTQDGRQAKWLAAMLAAINEGSDSTTVGEMRLHGIRTVMALADAEMDAATAELRAEHERLIDGLKACWKVDMRAARKAEAQRDDALGYVRLLEAMIVQSATDHRAAVRNLEAQLAQSTGTSARVHAVADGWRSLGAQSAGEGWECAEQIDAALEGREVSLTEQPKADHLHLDTRREADL